MTVDEETLVFECLNERWDILKISRSALQSFNSINNDLKGVLFNCISQNKLSFFEILDVALVNDDSLKCDAWYKGPYYRELYNNIDFHS